MNKTISRLLLAAIICTTTLLGCKPKSTPQPASQFSNAVYVSCEGDYTQGNAGVTLYDRDTKVSVPDIYKTQNSLPLGDVCQSMTHIGNQIYCVVNNSNKIEIVGANDFKRIAIISSLLQPRYLTVVNSSKAYLSEWKNADVAVLDLSTNTVTKRIYTRNGPEAITVVGNYAYVANCGGLSKDSTVSVIDTRKDSVVATLQTGINPCAFAIDANNHLWIMCSGSSIYTPPQKNGVIICIDPANNNKVLKTIPLPFDYVARMVISNDLSTLYFNSSSSVYAQSVNSSTFDNHIIINKPFYSIGLDPVSNLIFASHANFSGNGAIYRYNTSGAFVDSFTCGIAASNFLFK